MCHPVVKWLIFAEKPLNEYIGEFLADRAPSDKIDFAGPPSLEDMKKLRDNPLADIVLPTVTLTLKKDSRLDQAFVRVTASDDDIALIQSWMLRAQCGPIPTLN